jgi:hypothetical protein
MASAVMQNVVAPTTSCLTKARKTDQSGKLRIVDLLVAKLL